MYSFNVNKVSRIFFKKNLGSKIWLLILCVIIKTPSSVQNCHEVNLSCKLPIEFPFHHIVFILGYSVSVRFIEGAFLRYLGQFHVDLFGENRDWITTKASHNHRTQVGNVGTFSEGRNASTNPVSCFNYHHIHSKRFKLLGGSKSCNACANYDDTPRFLTRIGNSFKYSKIYVAVSL